MREHVLRLTAMVLPAVALVCGAAAQQEYVWEGGDWTEAARPGEQTPAGQVALIRKQIDEGDYGDAVKTAERFLEQYPAHEDSERAMYLAGRAEMRRDRYDKAHQWFDRQVTRHPGGRLARRALQRQYEIAEAFLEGKKRTVLGFIPVSAVDEGLSILDGIVSHAPGSELAERALLRIGDHHYDRKQHMRAVDSYDRYVDMFPTGEHAGYATLRAARATYAMYRGPKFDDTPLVEARLRFAHFAERFPREAERHNIAEVIGRVDSQRAEKDFSTAEFYRRAGRDDAAEFYYRQVIRRYGQTDWADRARGKLEPPDEQEGT